jgi:acyl-CoA reductase-like NAD-dependent aldehyde dehydrogenase
MTEVDDETKEHFDRVITRMDEGFRRVDERMDEGFRRVDERFRRVDERFRSVDERMDEGFRNVAREVTDGWRLIDQKFEAADKKFEAFRSETLTNFDTVFSRLDDLRVEYHLLFAAVSRLEAASIQERKSREEIRRDIEALETQIADLQHRLAELKGDNHDA